MSNSTKETLTVWPNPPIAKQMVEEQDPDIEPSFRIILS